MDRCEYKPTLDRALELMLGRFAHPGPTEEVPLAASLGRVAARDMAAPRPFPEADLSMMDGFAVGVGRGPGDGAAVRTGEPVPAWAEGVVPVEETHLPAGDSARFAANIVRRGSEWNTGEIALRGGEVIGHARRSQLRLLGIDAVAVRRHLRIRAGVPDGGPIADAITSWLAGFVSEYFDTDFRAVRISDPAEVGPLATDADLVLAVSDGAPGRYARIRDALLGGAGGFEPVFWKLALHPCRHAGFGIAGGVPVLVFPDVFFKTAISAMALLPPLLAAWAGARSSVVPATWSVLPELRHPAPCLVPLLFEGGCRGPGLAAAAMPLRSTFSARGVVDAEGFTILDGPPRPGSIFDARVLGRLEPGPRGQSR